MDNSFYNAVMRVLDDRRSANRRENARRRAEISAKIPEFDEVDHEISSLSVKTAKKIILMKDEEAKREEADLEKKINLLSAKKISLLKANGYPENYLSPVHTCPYCDDTGYVDGKKCVCMKQISAKLLMNDKRVKAMPEDATFDRFRLDFYADTPVLNEFGTEKIPRDLARDGLLKAKDFVAGFETDKDGRSFFIHGSTGTGKTFLAGCIANELINNGYSVAFVTAFNFFDTLEKYAFKKKDSDEVDSTLSDFFLDCDLLVLDDLGTELTNSFTASRLFTYMNERITQKKSTIISSNLNLKQIRDTYGERILSRIMGSYEVISLIGRDIRRQL